MKKYCLALSILIITGCGAVFNPYKGDFACPEYDRGKCVKVEGAYRESVKKGNNYLTEKENAQACARCREEAKKNNMAEEAYCTDCIKDKKEASAGPGKAGADDQESIYKREVNKKLSEMLKEPNTPLLAPPKVMRICILPYRGDQNELYMMRYVYLLVDEPKWVVGDYLVDGEE